MDDGTKEIIYIIVYLFFGFLIGSKLFLMSVKEEYKEYGDRFKRYDDEDYSNYMLKWVSFIILWPIVFAFYVINIIFGKMGKFVIDNIIEMVETDKLKDKMFNPENESYHETRNILAQIDNTPEFEKCHNEITEPIEPEDSSQLTSPYYNGNIRTGEPNYPYKNKTEEK